MMCGEDTTAPSSKLPEMTFDEVVTRCNLEVDKRYNEDLEIVIAILSKEGEGGQYKFVGPSLRENEQVIAAALKSNGGSIRYMPQCIKDNAEWMLLAVENSMHGLALYYSKKLASNFEFIKQVMRVQPLAIAHTPDDFRNSIELASIALAHDSRAYQYLSEKLRCQKDLTLRVVQSNGMMLAHANAKLRDDPHVVDEAIKEDPWSYKFAGKHAYEALGLKHVEETLIASIKKGGP